ncbi:MAG: endonuclease/exonuclease/phosphatase family protein [candidate division WOR-3 bacterium]
MLYYLLKRGFRKEERARVANNLIGLRKYLQEKVPHKTVDQNLLVATWNIRDFDSNKFKHGPRLNESFYYIAEIISAFDIVALQEVYKNLKALRRVMRILGGNWEFITTDVTEGRSGNKERMTFVYDRNKVHFQNIAGEIVLPQTKLIMEKQQFARTPYLVAFQSGWFKFMLCTVHIYYGSKYGERFDRRVKEIKQIAKFIGKRADEEKYNYILLGDFNIVTPECETMNALMGSGFMIPNELKHPTNIDENKFYDQIAFKTRPGEFRLGTSQNNAGVLRFYTTVFKDDEFNVYEQYMDSAKLEAAGPERAGKEKYYRDTWRTFQMSDHYPLWVELQIDFSEDYLNNLRGIQ